MSTSSTLKIVGTIYQVVGAILMIIPGGQGVGAILIGMGTAMQVGAALTARPPRPGRQANASPTYGIDVFQNPRSDAWIPWVTGISKVVPPIVQEYAVTFTEGRGFAVKEQGVAMLLKCSWGPIRDILDVRLNDEPLYSVETTEKFSGNGTTRVFKMAAAYVHLDTLSVEVGGVEKARATSSSDKAYTLVRPTAGQAYVELTVERKQKILDETVRVYVGDNASSAPEALRTDEVYGWQLNRVNKRKFRVRFQNAPVGKHIRVTFSYIGPSDLVISKNGKGTTVLTFGTAPASGYENIVVTFVKENFPGTKTYKRLGTLDQEPIPGFGDNRQTRTPNNLGAKALLKDVAVEETGTKTTVGDLIVGLKAPQGLIYYSSSGAAIQVKVEIVIEWRHGTAGQWRVLRHVGNDETPKSTFTLQGMTLSEKRWNFSIREVLEDLVDSGLATEQEEADFEALNTGAIHVKVTRKDTVKADSNSLVFDRMEFSYVTEVVHYEQIHPGQALLGLRIPAERLGSASPFVTCVVDRGDIYDPRTGGVSSSRNPALAVYDLIVSGRSGSEVGFYKEAYGGGWDFTEADLDLTELQAFANWCDETVTNPDGTTEKRHQVDLTLDVPLSLSEAVFDICAMARCLATLQGTTWRFPLDKPAESVEDFIDSTAPAAANIVEGSLMVGPPSYLNTPTEVLVQFRNRDKNFDQDEVLIPVEGLPAGTARNVLRTDMTGVSRFTEAVRNGTHLVEDAWRTPCYATWLAHPGAHLPEAGDVVTVSSHTPGGPNNPWTSIKVRVLRVSKDLTVGGELKVRYTARVYSDNVQAKAGTVQHVGDTTTTVIGGSFGNPPKSTGGKAGGSGPPGTPGGRRSGVTNLRSRQVA